MADKLASTVIFTKGEVVPGAEVYITDNATGNPAALYNEIGLTTDRANPLTSDERGKWWAYVATGVYDVRATKDGDEDLDTYWVAD